MPVVEDNGHIEDVQTVPDFLPSHIFEILSLSHTGAAHSLFWRHKMTQIPKRVSDSFFVSR